MVGLESFIRQVMIHVSVEDKSVWFQFKSYLFLYKSLTMSQWGTTLPMIKQCGWSTNQRSRYHEKAIWLFVTSHTLRMMYVCLYTAYTIQYTTIQKVSYAHQICIYLEEMHLKSKTVKLTITVFYFNVF